MNDLISRQAAIDVITDYLWRNNAGTKSYWKSIAEGIVNTIPAAHPKTAKIKVIRSKCGDLCGCECGCGVSLDFADNYCWRCGAKLIQEESK